MMLPFRPAVNLQILFVYNLRLLISKSWHALGFILVVTANFNLNQLPDYNISKIPEAHKILNTNNLR